MKITRPLNLVLILVGAAICALGLNVGLGGINTLGWQGLQGFFGITDATAFATQDSHVRFLGGLWSGVGGLFVAGCFKLTALRPVLMALCGIIAVAGLFRFGGPGGLAMPGAALVRSLAFELLGFPILALWLDKDRGGLNG